MSLIDTIGRTWIKTFGSANERKLRPMLSTVDEVNRLEPVMRSLSDSQLAAKTVEFRDRLNDALRGKTEFEAEEADEALEPIVPEAFATVREASRRAVTTPASTDRQPMRHFDVQIIGGLVLHRCGISEMVTGEGKTLVATLPAYLNALLDKGVHIVTVNDYLARRDREWMGPMFEFLGMTAAAIQSDQTPEQKRAAYQADITYGYDSEFGFDYLRDNMRWSAAEQAQLGRMYFAIVDEVDSVLIDEARTPLIISGPAEESTEKYYRADNVARKLQRDAHFEVKEKEQSCHLTEAGVERVERLLGVDSIYAGKNTDWPHHIEQALRAHNLYKRDVAYVVKGGEVMIVDEFSGRIMSGRRWSDGLHQAIEAKERLRIKEENQTLATITYQNFFRLYKKLAGMTGTALTEAAEFNKIYSLDVMVVPTNRPLIRREYSDMVYATNKEKWDAVVEEVVREHAVGRPLLVGTISIENSEMLSERLAKRGIPHEVLNAKQHEREAHIVAKAGQLGNVTIATNMAGRGTDIVLGGFTPEELIEHWKKNDLAPKDLKASAPREELEGKLTDFWACTFLDEEVLDRTPRAQWGAALERHWREKEIPPLRLCESVAELGGLHIIGTERHEARRIDNQLRGRAGRQGDPGSSRFFLSLEDDLMRIFANDRVKAILQRVGMSEGMAIESKMVSRSIERAQRKVEEHNFEIRKHLLEYDEVPDEQRKTVYAMRQKALTEENIRGLIEEMVEEALEDSVDAAIVADAAPESRSARPVIDWARTRRVDLVEADWSGASREEFRNRFVERALSAWADRAREEVATAVVESEMAMTCDPEAPFSRWDFSALARWGRKRRLKAEAEEMHQMCRRAVLEYLGEAAKAPLRGVSAEGACEMIVNHAVDTYLPLGAIGSEDWNFRGLQQWADALGLRMPVKQWQKVETSDEPELEEVDQDRAKREEIRKWMSDNLPQRAKGAEPLELVGKVLERELDRCLEAIAQEGAGNYKMLATSLGAGFALGIADSDLFGIAKAERDKIARTLAAEFVAQNAERSEEEFRRYCFEDMLETFLERELSLPDRDFAGVSDMMSRRFGIEVDPFELSQESVQELPAKLMERVRERYDERENETGAEAMRVLERFLLLQKIDSKWKDHLYNMDHLKSGITLRAYAQMDPKVEYTREAREMFREMLASIRQDVADLVLRVNLSREDAKEQEADLWSDGEAKREPAAVGALDDGTRGQQEAAIRGTQQRDKKPQPVRTAGKAVGRNAPCPCGSGKKYKKCCGTAA